MSGLENNWTIPVHKRPVANSLMHSFRNDTLLMDLWDVYPPVVADWVSVTIKHGVSLNFVGDRGKTVTMDNHPSVLDDVQAVVTEIEKEILGGRRSDCWFASPPFKHYIKWLLLGEHRRRRYWR